ncbi:MAG: NYN domain-containing protein [Candidatus Beckwithbacteria bacterium]|nr:NYN domain-containing protein [Candidatus Beckwithbacteria bacterium]
MPIQKLQILYIDGENLKFYLKSVLGSKSIQKPYLLENIDYEKLFTSALADFDLSEKRFYSAKLREQQGFLTKSRELIQRQRALKSHLEQQGFTFIISGNVRKQSVSVNGRSKTIFKEKGVDVRIAVDLVSESCDGKVGKVILCSSDSDLQPAVSEVKRRGVEVVYLGFEICPNKGLTYTTSRTILLRNSEVLDSYN